MNAKYIGDTGHRRHSYRLGHAGGNRTISKTR